MKCLDFAWVRAGLRRERCSCCHSLANFGFDRAAGLLISWRLALPCWRRHRWWTEMRLTFPFRFLNSKSLLALPCWWRQRWWTEMRLPWLCLSHRMMSSGLQNLFLYNSRNYVIPFIRQQVFPLQREVEGSAVSENSEQSFKGMWMIFGMKVKKWMTGNVVLLF